MYMVNLGSIQTREILASSSSIDDSKAVSIRKHIKSKCQVCTPGLLAEGNGNIGISNVRSTEYSLVYSIKNPTPVPGPSQSFFF